MGHRLNADVTITVNGHLSVTDGHDRAAAVSRRLRQRIPHLERVHVHVHPDAPDIAFHH